MRNRSMMLVTLLMLTLALPSAAGPYDQILCPMIGGRFLMLEGQLWVEITKQDDKPVAARREKIANPLDDRSHEVLAKRGPISVEVHQDKRGQIAPRNPWPGRTSDKMRPA